MTQIIKPTGASLVIASEKLQALTSLVPAERKLIEAGLSKPMKAEDYGLTVKKILDILTATFQKAGQSADEDDLIISATELYTIVTEKYPLCTIDELRIALTNGVYGEYGEYFGLNPKSFLHFVRSYMHSQERTRAKENYLNAKKAPVKEVSHLKYWEDEFWTADLIASWQEVTQNCYQWFLDENPLVQATPEGCYWLLKRFGKIQMPKHYVERLMSQAKTILRQETLQNKQRRSSDQIKRILEAITNGTDKEVSRQLRMIIKQLAVFNCFRNFQKKGISQIFQTAQILSCDKNEGEEV